MNAGVVILGVIVIIALAVLVWWLVASNNKKKDPPIVVTDANILNSANGSNQTGKLPSKYNDDSVGSKTPTGSASGSPKFTKSVGTKSPSASSTDSDYADNDEFKKRYRVFCERMFEYIRVNTVENRKYVNDAITSLSSIICDANNTLPNTLYMRKITILSELFGIDSTKVEDVKEKRTSLSKISLELAQAYSGCLRVDAERLRKFFDVTDTLFMMYYTSKREERRRVIYQNFMTLIDRLSVSE